MSASQRRLRVAVWGLGRHAIDKILPAVAASDGLEIHGVCSRNPTTVASSAATWGCLGWTDPRQMLSDAAVDIVYVSTPIGLHYEHGKAVLLSGKHLWCEKTLTSRAADTVALLELSRQKGLAVCEGHMYLYHPQFLFVKKQLSEGRLGNVLSVTCRFGIPRMEHPGFRSDPALGGGALLDVGCYPISAIQALFPEETQDIRYSMASWSDASSVDTDGHAVLELSSGAVANLEWRTNSAYRNDLDIWGSQGSLFTDKIFSKPPTHVPTFRLRDGHGVETVAHTEPSNHYVRMMEAFHWFVDDHDALEVERRAIARRAETIEQIRSNASTVPVVSRTDVLNPSL